LTAQRGQRARTLLGNSPAAVVAKKGKRDEREDCSARMRGEYCDSERMRIELQSFRLGYFRDFGFFPELAASHVAA
jgi:hypothetical protein